LLRLLRSGISPSRLLFAKDISVNAVRFAISGGRDPERPIPEKFKEITRILDPSSHVTPVQEYPEGIHGSPFQSSGIF